ncbi:leucyl/phenylalanyl-tRNA--protein transferase, partial [Campylobacter jejuni]
NQHLEFMGAHNISRKEFLNILKEKCNQESGFKNFKDLIT